MPLIQIMLLAGVWSFHKELGGMIANGVVSLRQRQRGGESRPAWEVVW